MNSLRLILEALSKGVQAAVTVVAGITVLWAIAYRFILGFTPLWLDLATFGAAGIAMLVLWAFGRNIKFDYSRRVKNSSDI